jgi:hypothetical protein
MPTTIFSDDTDSLLAALTAIIPKARSLLCVWYIQINIEKRLRPMISQHLLVYIEIEGDIRDKVNSR